MNTQLTNNLLVMFLLLVSLAFLAAPDSLNAARLSGGGNVVVTTTTGVTKTSPLSETENPVPTQPSGDQFITIDFDNVDIAVFIKFISELTGKNFVVDKAVRGNVTVISPRKISVREAYTVFESVLEVHGFSAIPSGNIIKIVPSREAKTRNVETRLKREAITPDDRIITQIVSLNYANPDELKKMLTPLVSKSSVILSYPPTGMLVVTDLLSNIERLLKIINALDIEGIEEQISVIPLERASSATVAKSLSQIFQKSAPRKGATAASDMQIVSDERTNTIITLASENDTARIRQLIDLLDRDVPRGEERLRVYRLENADAEELAKVLMNLPSQETKTTGKGTAPLLSKDINIIPDKATNTLIITAERDDYNVLEGVIKQLDIPRPMVYIEALIMEVNVAKGLNIGVEWMAGDSFSGGSKYYGGGFVGKDIMPTVNATTGAASFPEGLSLGVFSETINIGGIEFPNLGAIIQAYEKDENVHILSTPQILTLDNEEAEIYVGENVPYQTRAETSSTDIDYSSYE